MNDFLEKWKTDHKFKTKIKLLAYTLFVMIVTIYAISLNRQNNELPLQEPDSNIIDDQTKSNKNTLINIPDEYNYEVEVTIDAEKYNFSGSKKTSETTIKKENNNEIKEYLLRNDKYYEVIDDNFIITTKKEVYNPINYSYLNLENINKYLENSTKENNQYKVYLKDIVLGNDSQDYITIDIIDNEYKIDYTNLINSFDNNYNSYIVDIKLKEE